jgi:hypothetical protein
MQTNDQTDTPVDAQGMGPEWRQILSERKLVNGQWVPVDAMGADKS